MTTVTSQTVLQNVLRRQRASGECTIEHKSDRTTTRASAQAHLPEVHNRYQPAGESRFPVT